MKLKRHRYDCVSDTILLYKIYSRTTQTQFLTNKKSVYIRRNKNKYIGE